MNCPFYMVALAFGMAIGVARPNLIPAEVAAFVVGLGGLWLLALTRTRGRRLAAPRL